MYANHIYISLRLAEEWDTCKIVNHRAQKKGLSFANKYIKNKDFARQFWGGLHSKSQNKIVHKETIEHSTSTAKAILTWAKATIKKTQERRRYTSRHTHKAPKLTVMCRKRNSRKTIHTHTLVQARLRAPSWPSTTIRVCSLGFAAGFFFAQQEIQQKQQFVGESDAEKKTR